MKDYADIFVIGGGINGTAIAADAAGRGLSVVLCEKNDLASGTSSACSKLIHGGLRYLEFYEFGLVYSALCEREILLRRAPNLISPLKFILPHEKHLRPAWLIRLGLLFYDHLARRRFLPRSKAINLQNSIHGAGLLPKFQKGFSYYDCFVDDARLVIANALSAKNNNTEILTRTTFFSAKQKNKFWEIELRDTFSHKKIYYHAKVLINVSGPWVKEVQQHIVGTDLQFDVELDKGSHIIVPKMYEGNFAYILQNKDKRIIFTIPFLEKFTLIGTTDVHLSENLDQVKISAAEEVYLCEIIQQYFKRPISKKDIIWSYAGVRCLQGSHEKNVATLTRDYKLLIENKNNLPLLTVIGGKLTTHRILAEQILSQLQAFFPNMRPAWTADTALPGSNFSEGNFEKFFNDFKKEFAWLPDEIMTRYARSYGTHSHLLLNNATCLADLGHEIAPGLYQKEIEYLIQYEWAKTAEDILWRRTKLGLFLSKEQVENLEIFLQRKFSGE